MEKILSVNQLSSGYGELPVLHNIDLHVNRGEIVSVVGANGAGKSTLLLTLSGHLMAQSGQVQFDNHDITRLPAHDCPERGLVMVPEGGRLFPFMTVLENLELGAYISKARTDIKNRLEEVMGLFPILKDRQQQLAGRLSGGERQMCAIARAMMSTPKLLMLDEPSLGLAPIMVDKVFVMVKQMVESQNLSVLLVEQNVGNALQMSERGYILEHGHLLKTGKSSDLLNDSDIQRSYMGL